MWVSISDALELEFHEPSRAELENFRAEPSRAELDILEKRAESELEFLKIILKSKFFPRIFDFIPWKFAKKKA